MRLGKGNQDATYNNKKNEIQKRKYECQTTDILEEYNYK